MQVVQAFKIALIVGVLTGTITLLSDWFIMDKFINSKIGKELSLVNGSDAWNRWVETPIPIYLKVYIFTVVNPDEVSAGGKPQLKEQGPYVYREKRKKNPISIDALEDTVTYEQEIVYSFDESLSGDLGEYDNVTILNPALVGVTNILNKIEGLQSLMKVIEFAVPEIFSDPKSVFLETTVRKLLFDGVRLRCSNPDAGLASFAICSALKHILPMKVLELDSDGDLWMALLRHRNGLRQGQFDVSAGNKEPEELGLLRSWNKSRDLSLWSGDPCNEVRGCDMTLLTPFMTRRSRLKLFSTDICSSVSLEYQKDIEYKDVKGLRFIPDGAFLGDVRAFPELQCYCNGSVKNLTRRASCTPKGALDVSSCLDVPAILTKPHFLDASPELLEGVDGLEPDRQLHSTFLDVEPMTGIPLQGYQRIQVNLQTERIPTMNVMKDLRPVTFPLIWIEEGSELGPDEVDSLNDMLFTKLFVVRVVKWCILLFSGFLIVTSMYMIYRGSKNVAKED